VTGKAVRRVSFVRNEERAGYQVAVGAEAPRKRQDGRRQFRGVLRKLFVAGHTLKSEYH
jgi:hypothetical protein